MKFALIDLNKSIPSDVINSKERFKIKLWRAVQQGLTNLGHEFEFIALEAWQSDEIPTNADVFVFWNGQKGHRGKRHSFIRSKGLKTVCVEHGWIDRFNYFHFSVNGNFGPFSHFADKLKNVNEPVTSEMMDRVLSILGNPYELCPVESFTQNVNVLVIDGVPVEKATKGQIANWLKSQNDMLDGDYLKQTPVADLRKAALDLFKQNSQHQPQTGTKPILIIQQVAGDAQHGDFDYHPVAFTNWMLEQIRDLNIKRKVIIRTHPAGPTYKVDAFNRLDDTEIEVHGGKDIPLADDIQQAQYVLTFNSNSIHEAMIAGVPVVAYGPNLSEPNLCPTLQDAENGWQYNREHVMDYLAKLCHYQWNIDEIADGGILNQLIIDLK